MIKKITGIMLTVLALFLFLTGLKGIIIDYPKRVKSLKESVWLENGEYDPANEGKLVTMLFNSQNLGDVTDPDIGLRITEPAVRRYVDVFEFVEATQEWKWTPVPAYAETEMRYKALTGSNENKEVLDLDAAFSKMLPTGKDIRIDDITPESLEEMKSEWDTHQATDRLYITNADAICFEDIENQYNQSIYEENEGRVRMHYTASFENNNTIAVTGIQKDHTLIMKEDFKGMPVVDTTYGDISTRENLIKAVKKETAVSYSFMFLIILIIVYFILKCFGVIKMGILDYVKKKSNWK